MPNYQLVLKKKKKKITIVGEALFNGGSGTWVGSGWPGLGGGGTQLPDRALISHEGANKQEPGEIERNNQEQKQCMRGLPSPERNGIHYLAFAHALPTLCLSLLSGHSNSVTSTEMSQVPLLCLWKLLQLLSSSVSSLSLASFGCWRHLTWDFILFSILLYSLVWRLYYLRYARPISPK